MTELSRGGRNPKFLLVLAVLLVIVLFPLVRGLVAGIDAPGAAPAPAAVDVQTVPGTGAAGGFDACAVLSSDVVAAAGLRYVSEVVKTGPEPARAPGKNSCGGPVGPSDPGTVPLVLLTVDERKVTGAVTSHGIPYDRRPGANAADVAVAFPAARLEITRFSALADGEGVLAKLIDGVAARLADGPKPAPVFRYPAPYDLTAKPCDALPSELFTALTAHPTDGTESTSLTQHEASAGIKISCTRGSTAQETVTVTQTIHRDADAATAETRFLCGNEPGWTALPVPIGDSGCASPGADGRRQILFRAGRDRVLVEYHADHPPAGDLAAAARKVYDSLPHD